MREVMDGLPFGEREFQKKLRKAVTPKPDGSGIWGVEAFILHRAQSARFRTADAGLLTKGEKGLLRGLRSFAVSIPCYP